jgi:hypothetical protein
MAWTILTSMGPCPVFYTVPAPFAVGFQVTNRPVDVLLIQYLLRKIFERAAMRPLGENIYLDGIFGPQTHYWLLAFQASVASLPEGAGLRVGENVKTITEADQLFGMSKTIVALNRLHRMYWEKEHDTLYLGTVHGVPPLLKKSLKENLHDKR